MRKFIFSLTILLLSALQLQAQNNQNPNNQQILLQGFWWDFHNNNFENDWSNYLVELAPRLKAMGIDAVWLPVTIKNANRISNGYSPFDHYDLGEKFQKRFIGNKMGDKDELLRLVAVLKANGIDVIQDVVLNHMDGAGSALSAGGQDPAAMDDGTTSRFKNFRYISYTSPAANESALHYLGRNGRFPKNWQNFYPNPGNPCCTNEINTIYFGPDISFESNAFGLSSNATFNPIQTENYMRNGMREWMIWYKKQMGWDGVRLDAVKHVEPYVFEDMLWNLQNAAGFASGGNEMFAVGEWVGGGNELDNWANAVQNRAGTFDFALRNALTGIVQGNGNFNLGTVPSFQQSNRGRTVPFVNNHDTFRPQLGPTGNYTGWNTGSQLGPHIEPNDGRLSVCYAIILAVDGAPQIFFEDLFNIGYNGNRFSHQPSNATQLPIRSDLENLLWCHQNLRFKEGAYLVRWQAPDALVIERSNKALIAVNDNWNTWQNLTNVQTSFQDGTILQDYSGANGTSTRTVFGGGKVNIDIPPCNGTAPGGRRGYSVWAPVGINPNYPMPERSVTQEFEMANDLGDSHPQSLMQGGALPANSLECRSIGRLYPKMGSSMAIEVYPEDSTQTYRVIVENNNCVPVDSFTTSGVGIFSFTPTYSGWHTFKIRNASVSNLGQKAYVKFIYTAPQVITNTQTEAKLNCNCLGQPNNVAVQTLPSLEQLEVFPNPATNKVFLKTYDVVPGEYTLQLFDNTGKLVMNKSLNIYPNEQQELNLEGLPAGLYLIKMNGDRNQYLSKVIKN